MKRHARRAKGIGGLGGPGVAAMVYLLGAWAATAQIFEVKTWRDLSDNRTSRMGRAVMSAARSPWVHAESAHFIYHSESLQELARVSQESEFAHDYIADYLGLREQDRKARIFICVSERVWFRAMEIGGRREDGVSLHVGNEIYVYRPDEQREPGMDVAHELVHFRIQREFGDRVPLWLEEGLAVYLGWKTARAYQETLGRSVYREMPALDEADMLEWNEVFQRRQYPRDPDANRAFYRLASHAVERMIDVLGREAVPRLLTLVRDGQAELEAVLREEFGVSKEEIHALWRDARADALRKQRAE